MPARQHRASPGGTPLRLSILGTLEPDLLERLRSGFAAVVHAVNPQDRIDTDGTASADAHACLIDHRSSDPAPGPATRSQLPLLVLVDPAQPLTDEYLLARPHAERIGNAESGTALSWASAIPGRASPRTSMGLTVEGHGCEALLADSVESTTQQLCEHLGVPVPALLITDDTSAESLRKMQQSVFRVLNKPVDPDELLRCIAEMVNG